MKKNILAKTAAVLMISAALLCLPARLYAEPDELLTDGAADNSAVEEETAASRQEHLKPVFQSPVSGVISCNFGYRKSGFHHGLDIANQWGTNIAAIADGTVTEADWKSSVYGYAVVINHGNGWESLYGHCGMLTVEKGQKVKTGDIIAVVGSTGRSTGPHLHLEIHKDGVYLNPKLFVEISKTQ